MTDNISLVPVTPDDREQFILDNQRAFPDDIDENWSEDDELFVFRKFMDTPKK